MRRFLAGNATSFKRRQRGHEHRFQDRSRLMLAGADLWLPQLTRCLWMMTSGQ